MEQLAPLGIRYKISDTPSAQLLSSSYPGNKRFTMMEDIDDESTPPRSDGSLHQPPSRNMRPPEGWYGSLGPREKTDYNRLTTAMTRAKYRGGSGLEAAEKELKELWEKIWKKPQPPSPRNVSHPTDSQSGQQSESLEKGHIPAGSSVAVTRIGESEQDPAPHGTGSGTA